MLLALVLQATAPQTAVDAERAFNAAAQAKGQWTAFREFAAPDATMFVPQPVNAQDWLKDRKDPPKSVEWWPTESYVSCDGTLAVNTGGWKRPDGSVGYFTTVWRHEADGGWKWIADGGDALATARPRPAEPKVVRAACEGQGIYPPAAYPSDAKHRAGKSDDGSLHWGWVAWPDGRRLFLADLLGTQGYAFVIRDEVAAPK